MHFDSTFGGSQNTALGRSALRDNTSGSGNTNVGVNSGRSSTSGTNNTAIGFNSLFSLTTSSGNIGVGVDAGRAITTGVNNTVIGSVSGTAGLNDTIILAAGTTERLRITESGLILNEEQNISNVQALSHRNLLINGAMNISQRGTEETNWSVGGYPTCDRWRFNPGGANGGEWTIRQSATAPPGFSHSYHMECTTVMGGADNAAIIFMQRIESRNLQRIFTDKANGDTHPLTLSFWIRTNRPTGTQGSIEILQAQNGNRMFATSYTTGTQDEWEYVVINIPADNAADIPDDNTNGLRVAWWLNSGSDFQGTAPNATWQAINNSARNNVNLGVGELSW